MAHLRRTPVVALAAIATLGLVGLAGPAQAQNASRTPIDASGSFVVTSLCPFPVAVDAHVDGYQVTTGLPSGGSLIRTHLNETDVYSANGVSLVGNYTFNIQVTTDADGNNIQGSQTGTLVRVPLPNGTTFLVVGRVNVLNAQTDYISHPDSGTTRNLVGLCAALAG
jgi:hypothetical protein